MYTRKERQAKEAAARRDCGSCRWYDGLVHRCGAGLRVDDCPPDGCSKWEAERSGGNYGTTD